jgi:hypothetical protein
MQTYDRKLLPLMHLVAIGHSLNWIFVMSSPWNIPPLPQEGDEDEDATYAGVGRVISRWEQDAASLEPHDHLHGNASWRAASIVPTNGFNAAAP